MDAYGFWEGAQTWNWPWWAKAAVGLAVQLNKQPGESDVNSARRLIPSAKELLPVFNYLKSSAGVIPWDETQQKNIVLGTLNESESSLNDLLFTVSGDGNDTKRYVNVVNRDWLERLEGKWEDGKPNMNLPFDLSSEGDETILRTSAIGGFINSAILPLKHNETISDILSIKEILQQLNLDNNQAIANEDNDNENDVFVVALHSPGKLKVCNVSNVCDGNLGVYIGDQKLFLLRGMNQDNLSVEVSDNGEKGNYDLYLGKLYGDNPQWQKFSGIIEYSGEINKYNVDLSKETDFTRPENSSEDDNLQQLVNDLDQKIKGFDHGLMKIVLNETADKNRRLSAINQMRLLLSKIIITHQSDVIDVALNIWTGLDRMVETLYGNSSKVTVNQYNIYKKSMVSYRLNSSKQAMKSNNYYTAVLFRLADKMLNTDIKIGTDTAFDHLNSAQMMLMTSLRLK